MTTRSTGNLFLRMLAASGALALAASLACGGGGGGSSTSSTTPSTLAIGGSAAKGIIQKGIVTAYELVGGTWTQRGSSVTDATGAYTLGITGYTGNPAKLTITNGNDSTMIWDGATGNGHTFGVAEPLAARFTMSTVLPSLSATLTSIPITPYTTMADALVEASLSNTTATTVQTAISTINVLAGFDVSSVPVVDVTSTNAMSQATATEQQAAIMSAAVTSLAGTGTVSQAVSNLAASIAGGGFTSSSLVPIGSLTQAWGNALLNPALMANVDASAKTNVQLAAQTVNAQTSNGSYTPAPPANVPTSQVAAAKGLIGDTRSLVYNVIASNPHAPLAALGVDLEADATVFNRDSAAMTQILSLGLEQAIASMGPLTTLQASLVANGSLSYTIPVTSGTPGGPTLGNLKVTLTNPTALTIAVSGSLTGTGSGAKTVAVSANMATNLDVSLVNLATRSTTQTNLKVSNLSASVSDGTTSVAITGGILTATLSGSGTAFFIDSLALTDLDLALTTDTASFTGSATIDFIQAKAADVSSYWQTPYELFGLQTVKLNGTFKLNGAASTASIELDIANADTFDLPAYLNSGRELFFDQWAVPLSPATVTKILAASKIAGITNATSPSWSIDYWCYPSDGYTSASSDGTGYVQGVYTTFNPSGSDSYAALLAAYDPASAFATQLAALPAGSTVIGRDLYLSSYGFSECDITVQLPVTVETTSSFLQGTLKTDFTATGITGIPAMEVSAIVNRNALYGGTATFTLTWGSNVYTIGVTATDVLTGAGTLTVTSPQGVTMTIQNFSIAGKTGTGAIYVSGDKVADVAVLSSGIVKVTYSDGTFESFQ